MSGWRSHQAGHFPGGGGGTRRRPSALHSALGYTLHWILSSADPPHCPSRFCSDDRTNEMSNGKCDFRQTRAAGRVLDLLVASARSISRRHEERAERTAQLHRSLETSPSSKLELRPRIDGEGDEDGQADEDPRSTPYPSSASINSLYKDHDVITRSPTTTRATVPPSTHAAVHDSMAAVSFD